MNLIVAVDQNWGIGYQNRLLVSIPEDMKFFRRETNGKIVVMGRKTLESFPNGLPLKNRTNLVLTKNTGYQAKGAVVLHSVEAVLEELKKRDYRENNKKGTYYVLTMKGNHPERHTMKSSSIWMFLRKVQRQLSKLIMKKFMDA